MFGSEFFKYKNRIYAYANGYLTVSDVKKYVDDIEKLINSECMENWTFIADLRKMEQLSDDCYKELNRLREIMMKTDKRIARSAVVVDNLINQVKSVNSMYELSDTFKEEYFTNLKSAEDFLDQVNLED